MRLIIVVERVLVHLLEGLEALLYFVGIAQTNVAETFAKENFLRGEEVLLQEGVERIEQDVLEVGLAHRHQYILHRL